MRIIKRQQTYNTSKINYVTDEISNNSFARVKHEVSNSIKAYLGLIGEIVYSVDIL